MPPRSPTPEDFIGKKIVDVDTTAINYWTFCFDDGSKIAMEVDYFGHSLYGMVVSDVEEPIPEAEESTPAEDCAPTTQT